VRAIVSTSRAAIEKLVARMNAEAGYPRNGVNAATGKERTDGIGRTEGFVPRKHPTRDEWAVVLAKPKVRVPCEKVKATVVAKVAARIDTADDRAIHALSEVDLPVDWNALPKGEKTAITRK